MNRKVNRYKAVINGSEVEVVGAGTFWLAKMKGHSDEYVWVEVSEPTQLEAIGTACVSYHVEDTGPYRPDLESHEYEDLDF